MRGLTMLDRLGRTSVAMLDRLDRTPLTRLDRLGWASHRPHILASASIVLVLVLRAAFAELPRLARPHLSRTD